MSTMSQEDYVKSLVAKIFTDYDALTAEELGILSMVTAEPPPPGVKSNFVNPVTMEQTSVIVISILLVLVTIFVAIRVHVKVGLMKKFSWDDATLGLGVVCTVVNVAASLWGTERGKTGVHAWDVSLLVYFSMDYRVPAFIDVVLSPIVYCCLKASFFILYLQLFRPLTWVRVCSWIGLVCNVCVYTAFGIVFIYYSTPPPGKDFRTFVPLKVTPLSVYISAVGVVLDLAILVLPVFAISTLRMSKKRRFGAALVFLSGSLACICSALSVYYRKLLVDGFDQNWYVAVVELVYLVEIMIGIICACAPSAAYWSRHAPISISIQKSFSSFSTSAATTQRTSQLSSRRWPALKAQARAKALARRDGLYTTMDETPMSTVKSGADTHVSAMSSIKTSADTQTSVDSDNSRTYMEDLEALPAIIYRHQEFDVESMQASPPRGKNQ